MPAAPNRGLIEINGGIINMADRGVSTRKTAQSSPFGARILFHPNANTPQGRLTADQRRWEFITTLDRLVADFRAGEIPYHIVARLFDAANRVLPDGNAEEIENLRALVAAHPINGFIRQCPLTRYAQDQPRGQAGDPALLDFIYRHPDTRAAVMAAGTIGQSILLHNLDTPMAGALRARRTIVASRIATVAGTAPRARILSLRCGYARELELVSDAALARVENFTGVDLDAAGLGVASQYLPATDHLEPIHAEWDAFIASPYPRGFDLIYVPGLYERLNDRACRRLTKDLFRRLNRGGRLLIGNVLPDHPNRGYMELFLQWSPVHRDRDQLSALARGIATSGIARQDVFAEPNRCIGFLELTRA